MNWQELASRAENDLDFRQKLLTDPLKTVKEAEAPIPAGATVEIHENTPEETFVVLDELLPELPAWERVQQHAQGDLEFKRRLMANPRAILEAELGESIPEKPRLSILENTPERVHLVLSAAKTEEGELSEADLEKVAGGGFFFRPGALAMFAQRSAFRFPPPRPTSSKATSVFIPGQLMLGPF